MLCDAFCPTHSVSTSHAPALQNADVTSEPVDADRRRGKKRIQPARQARHQELSTVNRYTVRACQPAAARAMALKALLAAVACALAHGASPSLASLSTIEVSTFDDLQAAIQNFSAITVIDNITFTDFIPIRAPTSVTIKGATGTEVLSGGGSTAHFRVSSGGILNLAHLTLTHGVDSSGDYEGVSTQRRCRDGFYKS